MIISEANFDEENSRELSLTDPSRLVQFSLSVLSIYRFRRSLHFDSIRLPFRCRIPRRCAGRELDSLSRPSRRRRGVRVRERRSARFDRADNVDLSNAVPLTIDKRQAADRSERIPSKSPFSCNLDA